MIETVTQLKKAIEKKELPDKMVWVDQNHALTVYYLDRISLLYNRRIRKIFDLETLYDCSRSDFDVDETIYTLYLNKKEIVQAMELKSMMIIALVDEEVTIAGVDCITLGSISREACILFLEKATTIEKKVKKDEIQIIHLVSRTVLEKLVDYYENNLDNCLNEIFKAKSLDLGEYGGAWDNLLEKIISFLPPKDQKLRSLPWFSGGDIDTLKVLYNLYIKKLKTLSDADRELQKTWALLVRESIWAEACILSGRIGDYVMDYLRLVEQCLPGDFKVQFFPPVTYKDLENFPEWTLELEGDDSD